LIAESPNVRLELSSLPENVMLVREVLVGVAEASEIGAEDLNDVRTAVTEACNNVVMHAYGSEEGPLEVEIYGSAREIEVIVRDHGGGVGSTADGGQESSPALGMLVIEALAERVQFAGTGAESGRGGGEGTEVRMVFRAPAGRPLQAPRREDPVRPPAVRLDFDQDDGRPASTATITLAPGRLARTVLPRLLTALAARAHFSTDRISDAQLIADALAAHACEPDGGCFSLAVGVRPRDLQLRIAPLPRGRAGRLIADSALVGVGPVIEQLSDEHRVTAAGSSEMVALRIVDQR
jgi:serine/threonine-protein kinase RsbW